MQSHENSIHKNQKLNESRVSMGSNDFPDLSPHSAPSISLFLFVFIPIVIEIIIDILVSILSSIPLIN